MIVFTVAASALICVIAWLAIYHPVVLAGWLLVACVVTPWAARELRDIGREASE